MVQNCEWLLCFVLLVVWKYFLRQPRRRPVQVALLPVLLRPGFLLGLPCQVWLGQHLQNNAKHIETCDNILHESS